MYKILEWIITGVILFIFREKKDKNTKNLNNQNSEIIEIKNEDKPSDKNISIDKDKQKNQDPVIKKNTKTITMITSFLIIYIIIVTIYVTSKDSLQNKDENVIFQESSIENTVQETEKEEIKDNLVEYNQEKSNIENKSEVKSQEKIDYSNLETISISKLKSDLEKGLSYQVEQKYVGNSYVFTAKVDEICDDYFRTPLERTFRL